MSCTPIISNGAINSSLNVTGAFWQYLGICVPNRGRAVKVYKQFYLIDLNDIYQM